MKPIALVTGAEHGLGLEIVTQLAALGYRVKLCAARLADAEVQADKLNRRGYEVVPLRLDLANPESVKQLADDLDQTLPALDVLVNNVTTFSGRDVSPSELDGQAHRQTFEVNYFGLFYLVQALTPLLKKSVAGRVLNLSAQEPSLTETGSVNSPSCIDVCPAYQNSKAALNAITAVFAKELGPFGIKVNSLCFSGAGGALGQEFDIDNFTPEEATNTQSAQVVVAQFLWLIKPEKDVPNGGFF